MNEELDLFEKTFDELWKTEEYNFGTTDEDGYHNFDDYTDYPFAIEEMSILADEYQKLKQQLQAYKDKYSDLETDYAKSVENEKTLRYTVNKYYDELQAYKDKEDKIKATTPLELAIMFHDTYEELAPKFNYETRKDTKEFDENSNNGKLMIAVCSNILDLIKENE